MVSLQQNVPWSEALGNKPLAQGPNTQALEELKLMTFNREWCSLPLGHCASPVNFDSFAFLLDFVGYQQ